MKVLEIAKFKTAEGVSDAQVRAAWEASKAFAAAQPGFLSRKLVSSGEGAWMDLVEWSNLQMAKDAAKAFDPATYPELGGLLQVMLPDSVSMDHVVIHAEQG